MSTHNEQSFELTQAQVDSLEQVASAAVKLQSDIQEMTATLERQGATVDRLQAQQSNIAPRIEALSAKLANLKTHNVTAEQVRELATNAARKIASSSLGYPVPAIA